MQSLAIAQSKTTFRSAFCERFQCPSEAFEKTVFWKCLYPHAIPLARLIYTLHRDYFKPDFKTICLLGEYSSAQDISDEARTIRFDYKTKSGLLRNALRIRVSGQRLSRLARSVLVAN